MICESRAHWWAHTHQCQIVCYYSPLSAYTPPSSTLVSLLHASALFLHAHASTPRTSRMPDRVPHLLPRRPQSYRRLCLGLARARTRISTMAGTMAKTTSSPCRPCQAQANRTSQLKAMTATDYHDTRHTTHDEPRGAVTTATAPIAVVDLWLCEVDSSRRLHLFCAPGACAICSVVISRLTSTSE